jgi:hypothetical protein
MTVYIMPEMQTEEERDQMASELGLPPGYFDETPQKGKKE